MLKVQGLTKSFGINELFKDVSFVLRKGDRVGLVGANGSGKTTLLRCLLGEEEYDAGCIAIDEAATIGYLEQQAALGDGTLYDEFKGAFEDIIALGEKKATMEKSLGANPSPEALAAYGKVLERFERLAGYDYESRIRRIAYGLGFTEEELAREARHFSGGQKTRIALAKALLREPDILFLDEPTNHLDIAMIEWLEEFLPGYRGGVLIISHDRFFLDRVAGRILELENKTVTAYEGNYTYFAKVKKERRAALESAYAKEQEYIKRTEEYIRRYKAGIKAKQARGRQSQLNRLERLVLPPEAAAFNFFAFHRPAECANEVAVLEDVAMSYGQREIFTGLNLLVKKGDGLALIGPNGVGKTTLLKILVGELPPKTGRVKIGSRVQIGYFSQEHEGLNPNNTVLREIQYEYGLDEETARNYLGAFLFKGDDVHRLIKELSGGEASRLAFLKLMLTGANFLILDEPTNHLDIPAKEAVEEALLAFPGTFLTVSHDRYFLDKVASTTLELERGILTEYLGNYSYYRQKKAQLAAAAPPEPKNPPRRSASPQVQKTPAPKSSSPPPLSAAKREEALAKAEAQIAMAEAELKGLEHEMNDPRLQADPTKSRAIAAEYEAKEREIAALYDKWDKLAGAE